MRKGGLSPFSHVPCNGLHVDKLYYTGVVCISGFVGSCRVGPATIAIYRGVETMLDICEDIVSKGSLVFFIVVFYLSLARHFAGGKKRRVLLAFLTLLVNPITCYFISIAIAGMVAWLCAKSSGITIGNYNNNEGIYAIITAGTCAVIYLSIILLFAFLMARMNDNRLKSPTVFLFLMYNTLFLNQMREFSTEYDIGIPGGMSLVSLLASSLSIFIIWFFYRHCIIPLTELSLDGARIEWSAFLIPPAVFILFYSFFDTAELLFDYGGVLDTMTFFSIVIVCLFIWAFYVIIKNIKATNDAEKARNEVKRLSVEVMEALAHTIDAKDEYTIGHSVRVAKYSRMIAERLGLSAEDCENIYYMGLLHDIGKIGVPNAIINSPRKLTDEEYEVIKTHPGLGFDILSEIKSRPDLSIGARWHHERYDGKGYPDGKPGEETPYFARIIAVADSYDAMTSNRSYRKYMSQDAVRSEIEKNIGTQFDPVFAECMLQIIDEDVDYTLHE